MSTQANPLTGLFPPGTDPSGITMPNLPSPSVGQWGNPEGFGNPQGARENQRNVAGTNILTGQLRNMLLPQFANAMSGFAGPAGDFFKQLLTLGGPFYQRKQQQSFEQGTKASQDAAAQSRQELQRSGAGFTPSGSGAAMFGGEAQAEAGNQEEAFLNNLFQNEQLQALGAQGLSQLASLFNPAQLQGQTSQGGEISMPGSFFSNFKDIMQGLFGNNAAVSGKVGGVNIG